VNDPRQHGASPGDVLGVPRAASPRAANGRPSDLVGIGLVLAVALGIRLVGLSAHDFWYDEALEVVRDRLPWPRILLFSGGPDPPLFRVLMSPLARWSSSEAVLRAPSVLFSVATIWLVHRWIVRLGDARLALATAALLAVAPVQVYYAQEVSQYALAGMMAAATLLAMQRVLDRGTARDWLGFAAASVLSLLTYYGLVFLLLPVHLVLLRHVARARDAVQWRRFTLVVASTLVAVIVLVWAMLLRQYEQFAADHLRPLAAELSVGELFATLGRGFKRDVLGFFLRPWADVAPRWLLLPPLGLALLGAARQARGGVRCGVVPLVLAVALLAMGVANALGFYPFGARYAFFLSPLLLVLVAAGVLWLLDRVRVVGLAAGVLVVAMQLAFLPNIGPLNPWVQPPYENLGRAIDWVVARGEPDTPVYLYYGSWAAYALYKTRLGAQPVVRGSVLRRLAPEQKVATVRRELAPHARVFVVASHLWEDERRTLLDAALTPGGGFRLVALREEPGAFAALLEAGPGGAAPEPGRERRTSLRPAGFAKSG
jgi:hypothetical protein